MAQKTTYTRTDSEEKMHEPDSHLFEPAHDAAWGKTPLRAIQHITERITKTHHSEEIALELINANDKIIERLTALLEAGGIDTTDLKTDVYGAHTYIKLPKSGQDDLIRVAAALANTVDDPNRTTYYPLLPRDVLIEIADLVAANMQIEPLIKLIPVEIEEERAALYGVDRLPSHYIDVDMSGYAGTPVISILDNSDHAQIDGKNMLAPVSFLNVDPDKIPRLSIAFENANLAHESIGNIMKVDASSRQVVHALEQGGLLPHHFIEAFDQ